MNPESKNTMKHDEMLGGSSDVIFRKVNSRSRSKRGDTVMVSEEIESWEDATDASIGKEGLVGTIRCGVICHGGGEKFSACGLLLDDLFGVRLAMGTRRLFGMISGPLWSL
ncbi:hypothetical protein Tco_1119481 [Tanacetum coccineum]